MTKTLYRLTTILVILFTLLLTPGAVLSVHDTYPTDHDATILLIQRDFTTNDLPALTYKGTLTCSCRDGIKKVAWFNRHTVAVTVKGTGWQVGPIQPQQAGLYTFTDPGTYSYSLAGYLGMDTSITILNQPPQFPGGSVLTATEVGTDSVTLEWSPAEDDGPNLVYKIAPADSDSIFSSVEKLTGTKYTLAGLDEGRGYSILVQAFDSDGLPSATTVRTTITTKKSTPLPSSPAPTTDQQVPLHSTSTTDSTPETVSPGPKARKNATRPVNAAPVTTPVTLAKELLPIEREPEVNSFQVTAMVASTHPAQEKPFPVFPLITSALLIGSGTGLVIFSLKH